MKKVLVFLIGVAILHCIFLLTSDKFFDTLEDIYRTDAIQKGYYCTLNPDVWHPGDVSRCHQINNGAKYRDVFPAYFQGE